MSWLRNYRLHYFLHCVAFIVTLDFVLADDEPAKASVKTSDNALVAPTLLKAGDAVAVAEDGVKVRTDKSVLGVLDKGKEVTLELIDGDLALVRTSQNGEQIRGWVKSQQLVRLSALERASAKSKLQQSDTPLNHWIKYPPQGLKTFSFSGNFVGMTPEKIIAAKESKILDAAKGLVADDSFFTKHPRGDYNFWAALVQFEPSFSADQVPQFPLKCSVTLKEFSNRYGEPSSVGVFQPQGGKELRVLWYGPILIMGSSEDGVCNAIGGWPSRLLPAK